MKHTTSQGCEVTVNRHDQYKMIEIVIKQVTGKTETYVVNEHDFAMIVNLLVRVEENDPRDR